MSAIITDVSTYLEGQITELVKGTSLFRDRLPATLPTATSVVEQSSEMSSSERRSFFVSTDGNKYRVRTSTLQVYVRKPRKLEAEALAGQITSILTDLDTNVFSNFRLNAIRYQSGPTFFPEIVVIEGKRTYTFMSLFLVHYEELLSSTTIT